MSTFFLNELAHRVPKLVGCSLHLYRHGFPQDFVTGHVPTYVAKFTCSRFTNIPNSLQNNCNRWHDFDECFAKYCSFPMLKFPLIYNRYLIKIGLVLLIYILFTIQSFQTCILANLPIFYNCTNLTRQVII